MEDVPITTTLVVEPPYQLEDGVWRTVLTIPGLDGEIWFNHSKGTRLDTLAKLDQSFGSKLRFLGQAVGGLKSAFSQKTAPKTKSSPLETESMYTNGGGTPRPTTKHVDPRPTATPKPSPAPVQPKTTEKQNPQEKKYEFSQPKSPERTGSSVFEDFSPKTWSYKETPKYDEPTPTSASTVSIDGIEIDEDWFPGCGYQKRYSNRG